MSEVEQATAIGRAILDADASVKKVHALAGEVDRASEQLKGAALALREVIGHSQSMRIHDVVSVLNELRDSEALKVLVLEYEEARARNTELQERARQLRG